MREQKPPLKGYAASLLSFGVLFKRLRSFNDENFSQTFFEELINVGSLIRLYEVEKFSKTNRRADALIRATRVLTHLL